MISNLLLNIGLMLGVLQQFPSRDFMLQWDYSDEDLARFEVTEFRLYEALWPNCGTPDGPLTWNQAQSIAPPLRSAQVTIVGDGIGRWYAVTAVNEFGESEMSNSVKVCAAMPSRPENLRRIIIPVQ